MKKILLGAAALSVMFATSCKKNDDNNSNPSGTSTYTLAGTKYTPSTVTRGSSASAGSLTGLDMSGNSFSVMFQTLPTASGTYKIVSIAPSAADEVSIMATSGTTSAPVAYASLATSTTAAITVNNGKMTVVVPEISALRNTNGAYDTVKISGTLIEK